MRLPSSGRCTREKKTHFEQEQGGSGRRDEAARHRPENATLNDGVPGRDSRSQKAEAPAPIVPTGRYKTPREAAGAFTIARGKRSRTSTQHTTACATTLATPNDTSRRSKRSNRVPAFRESRSRRRLTNAE
jgi:hypothetical protein